MSPVYQPEIVAEAIQLAMLTGRGEMPVSFTAVLFALSVRLIPALVTRAIQKLGYGAQLTDQAASRARHTPTLFAASEFASPVRGAFDALARSGSIHIHILRTLARLTRKHHRAPRVTSPHQADDVSA